MAAPVYPSSSDVVGGQATLAAHYNTLRADALRAGATAANAVEFGDLLQNYSQNVQLEYLATNRVRIPYDSGAVPVLVIDGYMLALPTHCDLAEAPSGGAGVRYVFANRSSASTAWTLSVNSSSIEAEDQRLIGEFYWTGTAIRQGSIKSYEAATSGNMSAGLDAQKSGAPAVGDLYFATDTTIVYACFVASVWSKLKFGFFNPINDGFQIIGGDVTQRELTVTEGDLYFMVNSAGVLLKLGKSGKMTYGLCLDQGSEDDEILAMKSSDVAHGMTDLAETDTFGVLQKASAALGGLAMVGYSEDVAGVNVTGRAVSDNTTKSTSGSGAVIIAGQKKSSATIGNMGADANILAVRNNATTRFILDGDGDSHQDVGTAWTNFDEYDDAQLLQDLSLAVSRPEDPIRKGFGEFLTYNREALEKAKLVTFNEDGHHFVNMSKLAMLLTGAVRQQAAAISRMERMLEGYENLLAGLVPALEGSGRPELLKE